MTAIILGLISALSWGSGDFFGGLSSRRVGAYRAVLYAEAAGLVLLILALPIVREPLPPLPGLLVAAGVGGVGCLGLVLLYMAMAGGQMSIAAPVSALLGAALPMVVGAFTDGLPGASKLTGFGFALAAVWLISLEGEGLAHSRLADLRLPLLAGLAFGLYFVLMHQSSQNATLWPLTAARFGGTVVMVLFIRWRRPAGQEKILPVAAHILPLVSVAGLLDVGGNLFFILAGQSGRLDVAATLASLYPAGTVFLAWLILKEKIGRTQTLGILAALVAIVLMTL